MESFHYLILLIAFSSDLVDHMLHFSIRKKFFSFTWELSNLFLYFPKVVNPFKFFVGQIASNNSDGGPNLFWEDCEEKIDMVALASKEPILFYDEVSIYIVAVIEDNFIYLVHLQFSKSMFISIGSSFILCCTLQALFKLISPCTFYGASLFCA